MPLSGIQPYPWLRRLATILATAALGLPAALADEEKAQPANGGYCPASYVLKGEAVKGDPAFQTQHGTALYYFANEAAKKAFDADPEKYAPVFGEYCTTALGGSYGNRIPADPTVFHVFQGKVYLFSIERAKNAFLTDPPRFIQTAHKVMEEPAMDGYCLVSMHRDGKSVKGDPAQKVFYNGYFFYFADEEAKQAFLRDAARYIPQYTKSGLKQQTFCALGMSREKEYPTLPATFAIIDGKTYLFWDEPSKEEFMANTAELKAKADAYWEQIKDKKDY